MPILEMFVSLKVPDNIAITAFNTLKRMGYDQLIKLERYEYYKFKIKDNVKKFRKQISNIDILINPNKHKFSFSIHNKAIKNKNNNFNKINVLIQNKDKGSELLLILKERLGFKNILKIDKGVMWTMYFDKIIQGSDLATDITKNLLMNDNFQSYTIIK